MTQAPSSPPVPTLHRFKALCQNPKCREALGAVHFACNAGAVTMRCQKCKTESSFENTPVGIIASIASSDVTHTAQ